MQELLTEYLLFLFLTGMTRLAMSFQSEEGIKICALVTNYSYFYAVLWKFHEAFSDFSEEIATSWVKTILAPFLFEQHLEQNHAKHSIRRYIPKSNET